MSYILPIGFLCRFEVLKKKLGLSRFIPACCVFSDEDREIDGHEFKMTNKTGYR